MKKLFKTALVVLSVSFLTSTAQARVGDTKAELQARYGKVVNTLDNGDTLVFTIGDIVVSAYVSPDTHKCEQLAIENISAKAFVAITNRNFPKYAGIWEQEDTDNDSVLFKKDGAVAMYDPDKRTAFLFTAKRLANIEAKKQAKLKAF